MFYFVSIFFLLIIHKRTLPLFHSLVLALAIFPALFYLCDLLGVKVSHSIYLDILSLVVLSVFLVYRFIIIFKRMFISEKDLVSDLVLPILFFGFFAFIFYNSFVLPAHDPVGVPSLAKLIFNAGGIPNTLSPLSEGPFFYPPGYSIFLSIFYNFDNPFVVLFVFKYLNIVVVSLTPALWAFYFRKVYNIDFLKGYYVVMSFYFGYFLFDRTLVLALPYAGKNAVLYCSFLLPAIFYTFLEEDKTLLGKVIVVLSLLGGILIHYSFLYLFFLLLISHILVNIKTLKSHIVKYFSLFSLSLLLFVPMFLSFKSRISLRRSMYIAFLDWDITLPVDVYSLSNAWTLFKGYLLTTIENNYFFIFLLDGMKWNYKNIWILTFCLAPLLYFMAKKFLVKRNLSIEEESIHKAVLVLSLSILGGLILASGFIPKSGAKMEYVRWVAYNYNALVASVFFVFIWFLVLATKNRLFVRTFWVIYFIIIPVVFLTFGNDFRRAYKKVDSYKVSYTELKNLQTALSELSEDGCCNLITESDLLFSHAIQKYRPLEYYAVFSDCRILNGSWFILPLKDSRRIRGLPSRGFYELFHNETVYFIGREDTLNRYLDRLDNISAIELDLRINSLGVYEMVDNN